MKNKHRQSNIIQASLLLVAVAGAALLINPMRNEANRRADELKHSILTGLESNLDITIRYSSISPALLSAVTIKDLEIVFGTGSFYTERLRVFYNPLKQLRGDKSDPTRIISRIVVSNSDLVLNLNEQMQNPGPPSDSSLDFAKLLTGKTLVLTNLKATVNAPGIDEASSNIKYIELRYDGNEVRYDMTGSASLRMEEAAVLGIVSTSLESSGRFSVEERSVNGRLDIISVESDLAKIRPMSLDITYADGDLVGRRVGDDKPIDLSVFISSEDWSVNGELGALAISEILTPAGNSTAFQQWFDSTLDGTFDLSGTSENNLIYNLDLIVQAPEGIDPAGLEAEVRTSGDTEIARVEKLMISTEWGSLDFRGSLLIDDRVPIGYLSLKLDEQLAGFPVSASFRTQFAHGVLEAEPVNVKAGDLSFRDFSFLLIQEEQAVSASLLAVPEIAESDIERKIVVDALFEHGTEVVLHSFLSLEGIPASVAARLFGIGKTDSIPVLNDSNLNLRGFFEANRNSWVLNIDDASVTSNSNPENGVFLSGRVFPDRWAMDGLHVTWNNFTADGRLFAVSSPEGGSAEGKFLIGESIIPLSGNWYTDGRLLIESSADLSLELGPRSNSGRTLQLKTDNFMLPLTDGQIVTNLDVRGRIVPDDWDMLVNRAVFDIYRSEKMFTLSAGGRVSPGNIGLSTLSYADANGELSGNAVFNSSLSGRYMNGRLGMSSIEGEQYEFLLFKENDDWDMKLNVESARLNRFSPDRMAGTADLKGSLKGNMTDPVVSLEISSTEGILDGRDFEAFGKAHLSGGKVRVQDLLFDHEDISLSRGIILADLNKGTLRSTADINTMFNQVAVATGFSFAMDFNREISIATAADALAGNYSGTLATRPVLWDAREHLPAFTFQFARENNIFKARTPDGEILNLVFDGESGELDVVSSDPLPFRLEGGGTIKDGYLDLSFPVLGLDPQLINYVMVRDPILLEYHVVFQDGFFDGSLDIRGPAGDPDLFGTIRAENLKVDTPYTYSDISPASTTVHLDGNRITVDRIEIPIGDGLVYAEGFMVLDRWSLTEFDMIYGGKASGKGEGVPIYYPLLGISLDGYFTGEVRMTGDGRSFDLEGDLTFPTMKVSMSAPVVPVNQRKDGKSPIPFDINLNFITGNNMTFFLPNEQLKIVQATAAPNGILNFQYSTVPRTMQFTGDIPVKSGSIYYFDRDFQLTEGMMSFNENLESFDPILSLRAETKVKDDNNEDIAVALVYDAPIKSGFNPRLETTPTRTDSEILALFGQIVVPYADSDQSEANAVLLATGSVFAQAGIVQPFEEVLREGLNLDMVTLRTDIIENTLAEGLGRGGDSEPAPLSSGLGRYLDNTSLYAGKYIGDALFVSGSVSANYYENRRSSSVMGGLDFAASLSFEMQTPFFNVAWSYSPDPAINRNFVEDNSISLKWEYSF